MLLSQVATMYVICSFIFTSLQFHFQQRDYCTLFWVIQFVLLIHSHNQACLDQVVALNFYLWNPKSNQFIMMPLFNKMRMSSFHAFCIYGYNGIHADILLEHVKWKGTDCNRCKTVLKIVQLNTQEKSSWKWRLAPVNGVCTMLRSLSYIILSRTQQWPREQM